MEIDDVVLLKDDSADRPYEEVLDISTDSEIGNLETIELFSSNESLHEISVQEDAVLQIEDGELVDLVAEKKFLTGAVHKLKFYKASKIIRTARNRRKGNYVVKKSFNQVLESLADEHQKSPQKVKLKDNCVEGTSDITENYTQIHGSKQSDGSKESTKISKNESIVSSSTHKLDNSSRTNSFPKAIVYPDSTNNIQHAKHTEFKQLSFNEVFAKDTESKIKNQEMTKVQKNPGNIKALEEPRKRKKKIFKFANQKSPKIINEAELKPITYLIPQDLIADDDEKASSSEIPPSASKSSNNQRRDDSESQNLMPERPRINYDLIDALADYRVIARYLFNRLNIPPMDFDGTDDYINLYKLTRN